MKGEFTLHPWSQAAARGGKAGLHHAVVIEWVGVNAGMPWSCRVWRVVAGMLWLWHEEAELARRS